MTLFSEASPSQGAFGDRRMIPVNTPLLDGNEKKYLIECIDSGWISSEGPFVARFEEGMCQLTGRKHGVAVCNGSAALDVAVKALGIGPGDEVIMPTFTIISPALSVVRMGATPIYVDSDPDTWNMDVNQIEAKITSRTKAILVVHIYGLPVDMDAVLDIARRHDLRVIEDAAEMHGQTVRSRPCGSFGDISTFSFYANKHVTCGEGGMLVTNDTDLNERCRALRNLCFGREGNRFLHEDTGWNYRMTNLQAAVGLAQLEQLDSFIHHKREIGGLYNKLLGDCTSFDRPRTQTDFAENIYWVYGIVLKDHVDFDAIRLAQLLGKQGVGTRPFFWPMHLQPVLGECAQPGSFPVAERMSQRGLYVPCGLGITTTEVEQVASRLKAVLA